VKTVRFLAATLALVSMPAFAQDTPSRDVGAITDAVIEHHLIPSYERLGMEIEILGADFADLCAAPSAKALARTRASFANVVEGWSRISHVQFGPVVEENRYERLHFWPDRRGIGLRQARTLVAGEDEALLAPGALVAQSVAVQGLGAVEVVLFAAGADAMAAPPVDSYRCRYGRAVAAAMQKVVAEIADGWFDPDRYARLLRRPGPENPIYRDDDEVLAEYVGTLAHGFETIRDRKLLPILGANAGAAKPKLAAFWRSGLTLQALEAEFAGLANLLEVSGLGLALSEDDRWMAGSAMFEFRNAARTFGELPDDLTEALTVTEARGKTTYLVILTRSLQRLIGENIASALGLTVGFSALDGD